MLHNLRLHLCMQKTTVTVSLLLASSHNIVHTMLASPAMLKRGERQLLSIQTINVHTAPPQIEGPAHREELCDCWPSPTGPSQLSPRRLHMIDELLPAAEAPVAARILAATMLGGPTPSCYQGRRWRGSLIWEGLPLHLKGPAVDGVFSMSCRPTSPVSELSRKVRAGEQMAHMSQSKPFLAPQAQ